MSNLRSTTSAGKYTYLCVYNYSFAGKPHLNDLVDRSLLLCLRLESNPQSAECVNAEVVTKRETLTIAEIFDYIKQGSTKVHLGLQIS